MTVISGSIVRILEYDLSIIRVLFVRKVLGYAFCGVTRRPSYKKIGPVLAAYTHEGPAKRNSRSQQVFNGALK